ncbi:MAG TPA: GNAT family N-acetyltransferase [Nitrososphaera sp.]|nr:GNAT family N-acetyltransferase [Nitrososphaera sp.]
MIAIRNALGSDRTDILDFCKNTFSWGDYIDQVWDLWVNDSTGQLFVAESMWRRVGLAHAAVCPGAGDVWLEGIRVHQDYRRAGVANALIEKMLRFGRQKGAAGALAIVAADNAPSQNLMERNGFSVISSWSYYATNSPQRIGSTSARVAIKGDLPEILDYLGNSKIYEQSAKKYVESWRWYPLDATAIKMLVENKRLIVAGSPLAGIAVINREGYWERKNVLQLLYLDSECEKILDELVAYAVGVFADGRYERLQVLFPQDGRIAEAARRFGLKESEQFLLYRKVFTG